MPLAHHFNGNMTIHPLFHSKTQYSVEAGLTLGFCECWLSILPLRSLMQQVILKCTHTPHPPTPLTTSRVFDSRNCKCRSWGGVFATQGRGGASTNTVPDIFWGKRNTPHGEQGSVRAVPGGGTGKGEWWGLHHGPSRSVAVSGWMEVKWNEKLMVGMCETGRERDCTSFFFFF